MIPLRDENPTHNFPLFTILLIAANIAVFFHEATLGEAVEGFIWHYGFVPRTSMHFGAGLSRIFTAMFLHAGFMHLLGNMWFLWLFGDNIEDILGKIPFLFFYIASGVAAAAAQWWLDPSSNVPMIGASGAISGVLGAYMILHPSIRIKTLITFGFFWDIVYVPAVLFLLLWFVLQFTGILGGQGEVAFGAHIGGFVCGGVLILIMTAGKGAGVRERYDARRERRY